jgi:hypothetical protein
MTHYRTRCYAIAKACDLSVTYYRPGVNHLKIRVYDKPEADFFGSTNPLDTFTSWKECATYLAGYRDALIFVKSASARKEAEEEHAA